MRPRIIQYTPPGPLLGVLGRRLAHRLGGSCELIGCRQPWSRVAKAVQGADLVIIWSGLQRETGLCARLCRYRRIPHVFIEQGLLPQASTWLVDPAGFCGDSILNGDLSWVDADDMERLANVRHNLQHQYPLCPEPGRILVPLQVNDDTQVLFFSKYRSMHEFAIELQGRFGDRLVFREHPKCRHRCSWPGHVDDEIPFLESARRAERVVGLTSTCLYEAAILGIPVEALGNHPLRSHPPSEHDRVAAGALALRIDRRRGDLFQVLHRFKIAPLGNSDQPAQILPAPERVPDEQTSPVSLT